MTHRAVSTAGKLSFSGILNRLKSDASGNMLALMAVAVFPLSAMVGGAVDMTRLYMAQTRLQQACDAGALATRRAMGAGTALTSAHQDEGAKFFSYNFPNGAFGSTNVSATYAQASGTEVKVTGSASATMPATIMRIFGYRDFPLEATCQSTLSVPNTDVMFVLDNSGSMNQIPAGDTVSKIAGLRQGVKDFYKELGPGSTNGIGRIRYGFVPYAGNVNTGQVIKTANPAWLAGGTAGDTWSYQTRRPQTRRSGGIDILTGWEYTQVALDVFTVVNNATAPNPSFWSGASDIASPNGSTLSTMSWNGCIEEADSVNTITATSSLAIPSNAFDMQIDLVPSTSAQKWRPLLPAVEYDRNNSNQWQDLASWHASGWAVCPSSASKLKQYTDVDLTGVSTSLAGYVDGLTVLGGTQHDIGMIWGARFLSPNGMFGSENTDASAPGGFPISRHIVFMTDGAMDARNQSYGPWGISSMDGRQVPTNTQDIDNGSSAMNNIHYRRMEMICNAAKGKGYTIWVIGYGIATMPQSLQNCATDADHWALASNSTALKSKFKSIAQSIGGLRLSS
jgi:Flp pilus assembly protein TadG